jgi:WD40 repeat protein
MIEDSSGSEVENFAINDRYIFIWNFKTIKFYHLDDTFSLDCGHVIDLIIQDVDVLISIEEVRCGCDPNSLIIIINQSLDKLLLFHWDIKNNKEIAFYEIEKHYRIIWDKNGFPYCLMKDKVLIFE